MKIKYEDGKAVIEREEKEEVTKQLGLEEKQKIALILKVLRQQKDK